MTLKKIKLIHGLVIRISGDSGKQIGAHVEYVERIIDTKTGTVESAKMLPPEPLEPGADALAPLIGEVVRVQAAQITQMGREQADLSEALTQEREAHQQTQQGALAMVEQLAALQSELGTLHDVAAALRAEVMRLTPTDPKPQA
jgi:flagellar hook-basal body complex protein FliE